MRARMQQFFAGRNGNDDLNRFLNIVTLIFLLLGMFLLPALASMGIALYIFCLYRMMSRNLYRRSQENTAYLELRGRVRGWFSLKRQRFAQRKTHRFYKCPSCRQKVRVPRGRGKISITCPSCRQQFIRKS